VACAASCEAWRYEFDYGIPRMACTSMELETLEKRIAALCSRVVDVLFIEENPHGKTAYSPYCNPELRDLGGRAAYCGACGSATDAPTGDHSTSCANDCAERTCSFGGPLEYEHSAC
jgi:hypothetical protein